MMRSRYVPDLARFAAICESNYHRLAHLERLAPGRSADVVFELHDGYRHLGEVQFCRLESARYTETWLLQQLGNNGRFLNNPRMTVRAYHDADMLEVMSCFRHGRVRAVNAYPNARMHLPDEKLQVNLFLGDWLDFCLRFGQAADLDAVWSLES